MGFFLKKLTLDQYIKYEKSKNKIWQKKYHKMLIFSSI